jgi:hypothetical protein
VKQKPVDMMSNAIFQLVPAFLQYRCPEKEILVLSLDDYADEDVYQRNRRLVKTMTNENENIEFVFLSKFCTSVFLGEFIALLLSLAVSQDIPANQCMICSYIQYRNCPNGLEESQQMSIQSTIYQTLGSLYESAYLDCYYHWYGYAFYTYHMLYRYKDCRKLLPSRMISRFRQLRLEEPFMANMDYDKVDVTQFEDYWKHVIDITSFAKEGDEIASSIYTLVLGQR